MNELLLYKIITAILLQSTVIEGRFIVAEGYGNDANTNNFDDIIQNALTNFAPLKKKYPVSILMPPVEIVESYSKGWSRFKLEQYFLCTTGYTGASELKGSNAGTNVSTHTIQQDWKDMREVAGNFRAVLNKVLRSNGYLNYINSATDVKDYYRRVSLKNNDKLSGVYVTYELNIKMPCELYDYPNIDDIELPAITNEHPLHKH